MVVGEGGGGREKGNTDAPESVSQFVVVTHVVLAAGMSGGVEDVWNVPVVEI